MIIRSRVVALICCLTCLLAIASCGPSTPQLAAVKGRVTYRGRPLPYGTIVFVPDSSRGTHGNLAVADIQPDGTYTLKTNDLPGAVVGHHKVTISCVYPLAQGAAPQSPIPTRYRDPNQSGLTREVLLGKANVLDFNLD